MKLLSITEIETMENKLNNYFEEISSRDVDNIENIKINSELSPEERLLDFINEVKNPYNFIIDGYNVKFTFSDNDITAEECIENVIKNIISK